MFPWLILGLGLLVFISLLAFAGGSEAVPVSERPELPGVGPLPLVRPIVHSVIASQEGRIGGVTSSGQTMTPDLLGVALPSVLALGKRVRVAWQDQTRDVAVLDVGPWFEHDDAYVVGDRAPAAELAIIPEGETNPGTQRLARNQAGIDLFDGLIQSFGVRPEDWGLRRVTWRFLTP